MYASKNNLNIGDRERSRASKESLDARDLSRASKNNLNIGDRERSRASKDDTVAKEVQYL